ncbi:MAG TPA: hypothetical protein VI172_09375 [Candidatus Dormibacteraeota bacterium]|jgi:hypothetical protein
MTAPRLVRRLRTYLTDAQTQHLRVQLTAAQDRNRLLEQRLADLQAANEGAYLELRGVTGPPMFDQKQPFGTLPAQGGTT